jgi:hypothetical protein
MGLRDLIETADIHSRTMMIKTYPAKDACILVEGELKDDRKIEVYAATGEKRPKGILHHMIVRMLIGPPGMTLRDIEVEMPVHPILECSEIIPRFDALKGLRIQSGFTATLKKTIGGPNGCAHITSLLVAMASAAVQGFYAFSAGNATFENSRETRLKLVSFISDTCHVWRKDGPKMKQSMAMIKDTD